MGKIIITGATGFVGKHVFKYLHGLGYDVDILNRSEFINQDWNALNGVETVVHSAWCTDKDLHSIEHLEFAEWTCNFFNECKKRGIRVINMGSSSEYGVKHGAMIETMPCEPINAYGIAKLSVTLYAKLLGYNTLRLFSPYGEGGKNFVSKKDTSAKYGNPNDNRDYYDVKLVCVAVERLLHAKHIYGEIINVCSGVKQINGSLVKDTRKNNNKWYKYKQNQYEPSEWYGDNLKMRNLLNLWKI